MSQAQKFAIATLLIVASGSPASTLAAEASVGGEGLDRYRIATEEVRPARQETIGVLPGVIVPPRNSRVAVSAPFAGTVVSTTVLPGMALKKGAPVATILSREVIETTSQLRQAESDLEAAEAVARRYRTLADKAIAAQNRAEETEALARRARAIVDEHKRLLSVGSIEIAEDGNYTIRAPASGRVVDVAIEPGASVDAMTPVLKIDTSERMWVEAQLPVALIGKVANGDEIRIGSVSGKVLAIGREVDPKSRSVMLIGELAPDAAVVAGQLVTVEITRPPVTGVLEIPARALAHVNGEPSVFVKTADGFARTPVTLRGMAVETASVTGAFAPGAKVATSGLVILENLAAAE